MDVTPLITSDAKVIQSYAGSVFKVSGDVYAHPVLVYPDRVLAWDVPKDFAQLQLSDFQNLDVDVVLLGTGEVMRFLSVSLRNALREVGVAVEVMDTPAACRTYNVLLAEGRAVVAAMYPVHH